MGNALQSGFGIEGGIAAEHQGVAQNDAEQYKANQATQNAAAAYAAGQSDAANSAMKGDAQQGKEISAYTAGGVRTDVGSPLTAIAASANANKLDQLNILHKADVTSTNFMNQAMQDQFAGSQDLKAGRNNMFMNFLSAGMTSYAATPSGSGNVNGSDQAAYEDSEEGQDLQTEADGEGEGAMDAESAEGLEATEGDEALLA